MRKHHLIGALGIAAGAALIAPSIAGATTSSITADCAAVTFTYRDFGVGGQARPTYTITVDGVTQAGTLEPPSGPLSVRSVPLNLQGVHTVSATTEGRPGFNASSSFGPATFNCPAPPPPSPSPVVPGPHPGPGPVVTPPFPVTCAEKLALYPKAGPKTRKEWGCFVPKTKPPKPKTCADLRARGAGRKWLVRLGCVKQTTPPRKPPSPRKPPERSTCSPGKPCLPPVTGAKR